MSFKVLLWTQANRGGVLPLVTSIAGSRGAGWPPGFLSPAFGGKRAESGRILSHMMPRRRLHEGRMSLT